MILCEYNFFDLIEFIRSHMHDVVQRRAIQQMMGQRKETSFMPNTIISVSLSFAKFPYRRDDVLEYRLLGGCGGAGC
jgi:hypothetical protein